MTNILPNSRPELDRACCEVYLKVAGVALDKPALVARRGYYRDTMGLPGANDWGVYDDAIFYVSPTAFAAFNANTDPSKHHPGVAVLQAGVWRFKLGIHNQSKDPAKHPHYKALVQGEEFTVHRDGTETYAAGTAHPEYGTCLGAGLWKGWFGINNHKGGYNTTSSEGCQTIHPDQWDGYIGLVDGDMKRHNVLSLPYALTQREAA